MQRLQIPQKLVYEKFYVHEKIAAVDLSKIYYLKNAKKTCKPNNRDLNRDWTIDTAEDWKTEARYFKLMGIYGFFETELYQCAWHD